MHATPGTIADPIAALLEADRLTAGALIAIARNGIASDMPAEFELRLVARRMRWEATELMVVADRLRTMPSLHAALETGRVSIGQCRAIVRTIRHARVRDLTPVDRLIASRAESLTDAEPERLLAEVEDLCARLRPGLLARREDAAMQRSFLQLRPKLEGGGSMYGEADAESFASIAEALDCAADPPAQDTETDDDHTTRARQRMDALVRICEGSLAGGQGMRPRPRILLTMDARDVDADGAALLWPLPGKPPRLSRLATETALCDSEITAIAFDDAEPVAVAATRSTLPPRLRAAVKARDRGCRFPGCGLPAAYTDVHHIRSRSDGGSDDVSNLVLLCRKCHRRMHTGRWVVSLHPDGNIEFNTRGRRFTSPPHIARRE